MEARALLQAAKRGEMEALEELCRLYHPRLCRYAYALTRSREEAEDVAQEALVSMLRALPDFRGADAGKFEGWLLRIARNRVYSEARRKRPAPIPEGFDPPDPAPLPEEQVVLSEERKILQAALDSLETEERRLLTLRVVNDLSYAEIAALLEIKEGTVKSRLSRARERLRKKFLKLRNETDFTSSKQRKGG